MTKPTDNNSKPSASSAAKPESLAIPLSEETSDELEEHKVPKVISQSTQEGIKSGEELNNYIEQIAKTVTLGLEQSISILTPWFFNNMPQIYYQTTPRSEKVRHLSSIITGNVFEAKQTVELWDKQKQKVTYLGPGNDSQILLEMAYRVEHDLDGLDNDFAVYATDRRIHVSYSMWKDMLRKEGARTEVIAFPDSPKGRLTLGFKHEKPGVLLPEIFRLIQRYGYRVDRGVAVKFTQNTPDPITVMHFTLSRTEKGEEVDPTDVVMLKLTKALRTLAWADLDHFNEFARDPHKHSINSVNLLRSMASWVQILLGKENRFYYSSHKIFTTFKKYPQHAETLTGLFRKKFNPRRDANSVLRDVSTKGLEADLCSNDLDNVEKNIFKECLHFVRCILKTNYFMPTKTGLAFRLDPAILDEEFYEEKPFGIFFIVGRDYRMFHVRWRDISRGGVRVVMPRSSEAYDSALSGLFDEVYGLSLGQQLKNKDIPEGGSKGVLLLTPGGNRDKSVKGAVNALLDVLLVEDEAHEFKKDQVVSYYDKEEIIYLGPDENITNDLINWIPAQAARRGYKYAEAFMSSKPGAGINHKEYGVTSEGVNVYLENALHFMGIDPQEQEFRVKLTGGPDGDVAGNELKILHREYGANAKVVAVADGYGCAHDPAGLDWPELLRLVKGSLSIAEFDASKLSMSEDELGKKAFVLKADHPEGVQQRNNLHFEAMAEVFIPAGGRPYTVHEKNWKQFIQAGGAPTCRAIVEGANIFFTSKAREELQKVGILIFKDSSANKTGVICSSFEIIASLTLEPKEFEAIKPVYVDQVITKLREKADKEAKLLLVEYQRFGGEKTLVQLSIELSREINAITDSLLAEFSKRPDLVETDTVCTQILMRHCPQILVDKYSDRIAKLPIAHRVAILASYIASYVVYKEGFGWMLSAPAEECFEKCMLYMKNDIASRDLVDSFRSKNDKKSQQIADILERSAARDLTDIEIQKLQS